MDTNGHGCWRQVVIVNVARHDSEKAAQMLTAPLPDGGESDRVAFKWERWSKRRGDDEDIVFELSSILGARGIDWQVDWSGSVY